MFIFYFLSYLFIRIKHIGKHLRASFRCFIHPSSLFEGYNYIGKHAYVKGYVGFGSFIGNNSQILGKIGKYSSISNNVVVVQGFHPTRDWVSTHPAFYSKAKQCGFSFTKEDLFPEYRFADSKKNAVVIGNDVWIGARVIILAGCTIEDGAVVGAGSVVTKDVKAYEVVCGVPAKPIRKRFDDETINFLLDDKWWNKKHEWLCEHYDCFDSIEKYVEFMEGGNN